MFSFHFSFRQLVLCSLVALFSYPAHATNRLRHLTTITGQFSQRSRFISPYHCTSYRPYSGYHFFPGQEGILHNAEEELLKSVKACEDIQKNIVNRAEKQHWNKEAMSFHRMFELIKKVNHFEQEANDVSISQKDRNWAAYKFQKNMELLYFPHSYPLSEKEYKAFIDSIRKDYKKLSQVQEKHRNNIQEQKKAFLKIENKQISMLDRVKFFLLNYLA